VKAAQRRGVKFGRKSKLTQQQIAHTRKLIDQGEDRQKVADLFKVADTRKARRLKSRASSGMVLPLETLI
jgi:Helix-turn-helix domain of resolvase